MYQYYTFILICEIVERNALVGIDGLIRTHVEYLSRCGITSNDIYSSGVFWRGFLYYENNNVKEFSPVIEKLNYSDDMLDDIEFDVKLEISFFDCIKQKYDYREMIECLNKYKDFHYYQEYRYTLFDLTGMLCNIVKYGTDNIILENNVKQFVEDENSSSGQYIIDFFSQFIEDQLILKDILKSFKYRIRQVGLIDDYLFGLSDVSDVINYVYLDDFEYVSETVQSYLRLCNYKQKKANISSIWKVYFMYFNHKDYTVLTLPEALITFETLGFIDETYSIKLITRTMNMSDKGIRYLLNVYTDLKDDDFITRAIENFDFINCNKFNFLDISPCKLNLLNENLFYFIFEQYLYRHRRSKILEFSDIENSLISDYKDFVINKIINYGYSISNVTVEKELFFKEYKLDYTISNQNYNLNRVPLDNGYIYESDFDYIKKEKYSLIDIAKLPGGWFECLPYLDVFKSFDDSELNAEMINIIHSSMFTNIPNSNYIGYWHNYLGYIPKLLYETNYPIEWDKLFGIFEDFLDCSLL